MTKFINSCCYDCEYSVKTEKADGINVAILYIGWFCQLNDRYNEKRCNKYREAEEIIEDRIEQKAW